MDKKYRDLFTLIAQSVANLAEQVMNDHEKKNETKEQETAQTMRNDYLNLLDKLKSEEELVKADYARVLVGAVIVTSQLENRIKNEQNALQAYKIDLIPKLDQINNAEIDDVPALAQELFTIIETEEKSDN